MNSYGDFHEDIPFYVPPRTSPSASAQTIAATVFAAIVLLATLYGVSLQDVIERSWRFYLHALSQAQRLLPGQPNKMTDVGGNTKNPKDALESMARSGGGLMAKVLGFGREGLLKGDIPLRGIGSLLKGSAQKGPPGLGNYDNSCYQNSVIQGLASITALPPFFEQVTSRFRHLKENTTNSELQDIIQQLNDPGNSGRRLWTPKKLKSMSSWQQQDAQEYFSKVLDDVDKEIIKAQREEGQVSGLESLTEQAANEPPTGTMTPTSSEAEQSVTSHSGFRRNPLEGYLAYRSACTECKHTEGLKMIPFWCITLPLGPAWSYTVQGCLDEYTNPDYIDDVECASCTLLRAQTELTKMLATSTENIPFHNSAKARLETIEDALERGDYTDSTLATKCNIPKKHWKKTRKVKQEIVGRPPNGLVLHVNRSIFDPMTAQQYKNTARLEFQNILNMDAWCLGGNTLNNDESQEVWPIDPTVSMLKRHENPAKPNSNVSYDLRAVVTHYGAHENGHYICYRKTAQLEQQSTRDEADPSFTEEPNQEEQDISKPVQRWWRISDDDVYPVSEAQVLSQPEVFMLFYERVPVEHGVCEERVEQPAQSANIDSRQPADSAAALQEETAHKDNSSFGAQTSANSDLVPLASSQVELPKFVEPSCGKGREGISILAAVPRQRSENGAQNSPDTAANDGESTVDNKSRVSTGVEEVPTLAEALPALNTPQPLKMRTAGVSHQQEQPHDGLRMVAAT